MPHVEVIVAAAVAIVGYNLLQGEDWVKTSSQTRKVVRVALVGSAAVFDTKVAISAGGKRIATVFNTVSGATPALSKDFYVDIQTPEWIRAGEALVAEVLDAPATNPIVLAMDILELPPRRGY